MSKIKDYNDVYGRKEKLRHRLRRKESANKKISRLNKAKNGEYSYGCGYYVREEKARGVYRTEVIPAHTEEKTTLVVDEYTRVEIDENGKPVTVTRREYKRKTELVEVPERKVRRCVKMYWDNLPPVPRRINVRKKWYKKMAARAVRRADVGDGSSYKRVYDIAWSIW